MTIWRGVRAKDWDSRASGSYPVHRTTLWDREMKGRYKKLNPNSKIICAFCEPTASIRVKFIQRLGTMLVIQYTKQSPSSRYDDVLVTHWWNFDNLPPSMIALGPNLKTYPWSMEEHIILLRAASSPSRWRNMAFLPISLGLLTELRGPCWPAEERTRSDLICS